MIKTTAMLKNGLQEYVNPIAKIRHLVDSGELVLIVRGLYETDGTIPRCNLASIIMKSRCTICRHFLPHVTAILVQSGYLPEGKIIIIEDLKEMTNPLFIHYCLQV